MCRALIITVEHQSPELTAQMRASLERTQGQSDLFLLIVRNVSDSYTHEGACSSRESAQNVWILSSAINRGYFGGVKQGLEWFQETQGDLPEWIIVCNNDIRLEQADFFERLSQLDPRGIGVVAPKIISCRTGLNQNPFMVRRPNRWRVGELRFWLQSYYSAFVHEKMSEWKHVGASLRRRFLSRTLEAKSDPPKPIYAPHGSFLIFSHQFFARGGFLDDGFFLFHEEISVAEICRKIVLPILYTPQLCVFHEEHSSTGTRFTRAMYEYQKRSFQHLMANYLADLI